MRISISKISAYLDCPRKYWYIYEIGVETPKSEGFYFGSAIHSGLENYYSGKDPMEAVKKALFGKKVSIGEQVKEGIDLNKLLYEARRIFEIYPDKAPYFNPLLVEHYFRVPLVHPETKEKLSCLFSGKMDLVTNNAEIVDHKTAKSSPGNYFEAQNNRQANGYACAYWTMFGKLPAKFIFNNIIIGNTKREPSFEQKVL